MAKISVLVKGLVPGAIWEKVGSDFVHAGERVYIESIKTSLLLTSKSFVDIRNEFGVRPIPTKTFLEEYIFIGWARIGIRELTSDKNLILEGEEDDNDLD